MTSRELVHATLDFRGPERIPTDLWLLPALTFGREEAIRGLLARYPTDLYTAPCADPLDSPHKYTKGSYMDGWGCGWVVLQDGLLGEVKHCPLADDAALAAYAWPRDVFDRGWGNTAAGIAAHRERFVTGGWVRPFERMQFLRGVENLYLDLAEENETFFLLRDRVFAYYREYLARWVRFDVDAIVFADDWGSQRSLLISPARWRELFRPQYQELFDIVRAAGKRIFFHCDGYILDIIPDLIEMGVDALNAQVWCMGLDALAPFAGRVTFWGELDRQHLIPNGTPQEIVAAARRMAETFWRDGGLIGLSEPEYTTPLAKVEAAVASWWQIDVRDGLCANSTIRR